MSFVIFGLPRSRTAWLSRFLSYREWHCGHDELMHVRGLQDIEAWFSQAGTGTVETAAAPWWRLIKRFGPDAAVVVVRRPVAQVIASLKAVMTFDEAVMQKRMEQLDHKLDQIAARMGDVLSVTFDELATEEGCKLVFEHCLPFEHDREHWRHWDAQNVQVNMAAVTRYAAAYREPLEKVAQIARQQILADLTIREPVNPEGITIQEEGFDSWLSDARPLFEQHLVTVGESPENWRKKNIDLMRRLDDAGAMQIMTARSNGRMFGYLMNIISPSLVSPEITTAVGCTFYADPSFTGLGMKLQRAALRNLKAKGVNEVFFEAGHRGSGPRLGTMYRRLGAAQHGQVYRLAMEA